HKRTAMGSDNVQRYCRHVAGALPCEARDGRGAAEGQSLPHEGIRCPGRQGHGVLLRAGLQEFEEYPGGSVRGFDSVCGRDDHSNQEMIFFIFQIGWEKNWVEK